MGNVDLHTAVLADEVINSLNIKDNGTYLDATFGRGGHSRKILESLSPKGRLIVVDRDPYAIDYAKKNFSHDPRVTILWSDFASIDGCLKKQNLSGKINGIIFDLGVSSPQFDDPSRGFSLKKDGPLDMRMNPESGSSAADWLNLASQEQITQVLQDYGEEKHAKLLARCIIQDRKIKPFTSSIQLANLVDRVIGKFVRKTSKIHPATKTFQAIRIHINDELGQLKKVLNLAIDWLDKKGRLAVISFHSLEDRLVKRFMRDLSVDKTPIEVPLTIDQLQTTVKIVSKVIKASAAEIKLNPRARSARLRVVEKL